MSRSKSDPKPKLGITPGDPAGIGPDITLAAYRQVSDIADIIVFADMTLLRERADMLGLTLDFCDLSVAAFRSGALNVQPIALAAAAVPGQPDKTNAAYVLATLEAALAACQEQRIAGMITGPVSKAVIAESGVPFSGHTEWLAEKTGTARVVMMLATADMRVALATTHLPLAAVPAAITPELLTGTLEILHHDLQSRFGIARPRISVCGLNPHAGEGGHLGREELDVIIPVLQKLQGDGMLLTGPLPADTAFTPRALAHVDAVLAMYHDQGLPVIKHAGFGDAVNITLGLPVLRTSVDHGTAFELAGTGQAEPDSMVAAVRCAAAMA